MKKELLLSLFFLLTSVFTHHLAAIHNSVEAKPIHIPMMSSNVTVNDFIAVDVKQYRTADGKKLKWSQRMLVQMTQKQLAGKVKRGKIDGASSMAVVTDTKSDNTLGFLSLILIVAGLFVPVFGLTFLLTGFILGIIGIKKDTNPTMATIGVVLGSLIIFLLMIALISGAYEL